MYTAVLTSWPIAMSTKPDFEEGDKIILPQQALLKIKPPADGSPLIFKLTNPANDISLCSGVAQFTAISGTCYVPYWIMNQLSLPEGKPLEIKSFSCPKAEFVKIKLYRQVSDPKALLEVALRRFTCLNKNTTVTIPYVGEKLNFDVTETRPTDNICVTDVDCDFDFEMPPRRESFHRRNSAVDLEEPLDLTEEELPDRLSRTPMTTDKAILTPLKKFPGKGRRLGSE